MNKENIVEILDTEVLVTYIPPHDDTYECLSHDAVAVVHAPNGTWVFSKRLNETNANTWQSDHGF